MGLYVQAKTPTEATARILEAERAGVSQVWMTAISVAGCDTTTILGAAAAQTKRIRLGTSIIPIYTRHPVVMAQQALTLNDLAPGRFSLGVGVSHRRLMEETFGVHMVSPLQYLREYVTVLRGALSNGKVDYHGSFLNVSYNSGRTADVPVLVSALGPKAFEVAGEISDGAISWICPVPYLLGKAVPALRKGAAAAHRPAPPIVANVLVAFSEDFDRARDAARGRVQWYSKAPFYANMFAESGNPLGTDGRVPDRLLEGLLVYGTRATIESRLRELLAGGLDELLVALVPTADEGGEWGKLLDLIGSI